MFENHFYNESTRRMVSVFGSIFNDMEVVKKNAAGKVLTKIKVPLGYAPRTKVLARLNEQTSDPKLAIKLPRLSFEISSMDYDANARVSKHKNYTKVITGDTLQLNKLGAPAVYKVGFELNIMAATQDEALQLLEQILPMFQPEYTVTIKDIPSMDIKTDTPIILESVALNDDYEGDLVTRRAIIYTLSFSTRIRYYRGLGKSKQILQTEVDFSENVDPTTHKFETLAIDGRTTSDGAGGFKEPYTETINFFDTDV
jgi:predicted Zn-dependent protease with MMP-like domain